VRSRVAIAACAAERGVAGDGFALAPSARRDRSKRRRPIWGYRKLPDRDFLAARPIPARIYGSGARFTGFNGAVDGVPRVGRERDS
jgi:hypothetical protein